MGMPGVVPLLLVLLLVGVLAALLWRDRRSIRRAGISEQRPGCSQCLYPLGGWSSPRCPECGASARTHGVRIGPRAGLGAALLALWLLLLAMMPVLGGIAMALTARASGHIDWRLTGEAAGVRATIDAPFHWRRFPIQTRVEATLTIATLPPPRVFTSRDGHWVLEPATQPITPPQSRTRSIASAADIPPVEAIAADIAAAAGREVNDDDGLRATDLRDILVHLQSANTPQNLVKMPKQRAAWRFSGGHGFGGGSGSPWAALACVAILSAIGLWLSRRISAHWPRGSRAAEPEEWTRTPVPEPAGAQQ